MAFDRLTIFGQRRVRVGHLSFDVQGDRLPVSTNSKKQKSGLSSASGKSEKDKGQERTDSNRDVGLALRSIYQKTVDEAVPSEMLDLLGKLG